MRISDWSSDVCSSDLGVGVIALQITMLQPQHPLRVKAAAQGGGNVLARACRVALVQAVPGAEDAACTIALDRAAFQREVDALMPVRGEHTACDQFAHQDRKSTRLNSSH